MSRLAALKSRTREIEGSTAPMTATTALGLAMLDGALPAQIKTRLTRPGPFGLILLVPSAGHIDLVCAAIEHMLSADKVCVVGLEQPGRLHEAEKLVEGISQRKKSVAVAVRETDVPTSFRALANQTIRLLAHDAAVVHKALRTLFEKRVPDFPDGTTMHPDPELLCRCVVVELPAQKTIDALINLGKTVKRKGSLPPLEECHEYGEARDWGLGVAADIAAWRSGKLAASELSTACLLASPPGFGKTRYAHVLAQTMGVPLIEMTVGSVFASDGHLGEVLRSMREHFAEAISSAPAVMLLDEIDSFSRRDVRDNNQGFALAMVNELLTLVENASRTPGLVIIGATNLPEALDPALLRPGRLYPTIVMPLPNADGIEHILRVLLHGDLIDESLEDVIRMAEGSTPAELSEAVKSARRMARQQARAMALPDLVRQFDGGFEEDEELLLRVAVHEAGHALACLLVPDAPELAGVRLMPTGDIRALTSTMILPGANTRARMEGRIMMLLAGRAAENALYGDENASDGALGDLAMATEMACAVHARLGLGDRIIHLGSPTDDLMRDPDFAEFIEGELQRMLEAVTKVMVRHRAYILAIAMELVAARSLTAHEVVDIVRTMAQVEAEAHAAMGAKVNDAEHGDDVGDGATVH